MRFRPDNPPRTAASLWQVLLCAALLCFSQWAGADHAHTGDAADIPCAVCALADGDDTACTLRATADWPADATDIPPRRVPLAPLAPARYSPAAPRAPPATN